MSSGEEEEKALRSVALQNAASILQARRRAEDDLLRAKRDLEQKTEALATSLAMMRATLESTSNAILAVNADGMVSDFNQNFVQMWRLPSVSIASTPHRALLSSIATAFATDAAAFVDTVARIEKTDQAESFDILELADGRTIERFSKLQLIDGSGGGRVWSFRDISVQRQAQAALFQSEATLRATFNQAAVGVAIAALDGRFSEINQRFSAMLGYSVGELVGRTFTDLTYAPDRSETITSAARLLGGEIPDYSLEKRYVRKDGSLIWSHTSVTLRRDESGRPESFIGVVEDISASKASTLALQEERKALELLYQTGTALASTLDLQTLLRAATEAGVQLSGAQCGALFLKTAEPGGDAFVLRASSGLTPDVLDDPTRAYLLELIGPVLAGAGGVRGDDVLPERGSGDSPARRGSSARSVVVSSYVAVPVTSHVSELIGVLVLTHAERARFNARTERLVAGIATQAGVAIDNAKLYLAAQAAAEERKLLLERERSAREQAEHLSDIKDEFLATLSHELRTPLSAILGWAYVLRTTKPSAEQVQKGMETIERNARVQTQLIEDLLDMSRITSGKLRLDVQPLEPASFIEAALETVKPAAEAKGIRIESMLDPSAGPIAGDPGRLQQVIWNLVSNAIKFTPKEGKVQVLLERVNSHVEITVADTGMGIEPRFLPHVFERFRQADASTTRSYSGLGLGLAIVKHLVELHGGSVHASSDGEGRGAAFVVHLPVTAVKRRVYPEPRSHPTSSQGVAPQFKPLDLSGLTVLVVDDESDSRELIKHVLEESRATVRVAGSAQEAIALVERERPHVLVSDIGMPEVDGFELLKRVRALGEARGGQVPAIALTAFARSEDRTRALRAGFRVHVSKPVEPAELLATVASVAGRSS